MNMGNRKRLKQCALELEQLAKGTVDTDRVVLFLLDIQERLIVVQRDLVFRPDANKPVLTGAGKTDA